MTDVELVRGAQQKNAEAWRTLYQRYLPSVWRCAYALLGDTHLAEDVVGETMLALLHGIDGIDTEAPKISAWLRSVVRHKVADHHRRNYRSEQRMNQMLAGKETNHKSDTSPAEPLEVAETREQVLEILDDLPERQRIVLEWKYVEGLCVREIAQRLGETEKAVEATLYRARREFRRLFGLSENQQSKVPNRVLHERQAEFDSPSQ